MSHVVGGPAERDGVAIDDAGHDRRQIVRRRSGECFVHQPQAFLDPSESHQRAGLFVPREPDQIRIPEPLADLGGLQRRGVAILEVAATHLLQPDGNQQVASLDAVTAETLEQPLARANQPVPRARSPLNRKL